MKINFDQQIQIILESIGDSRKSIHRSNLRIGDILYGNTDEPLKLIKYEPETTGRAYYKYWLENPDKLIYTLHDGLIRWKYTNKMYQLRRKFKPEDADKAMSILDI